MKVFFIAGAVAAVALAGVGLWYTSDSHRFNQAVQAAEACEYDKALELFSKISGSGSKYYQPALILGLEARSQAEEPSAEVIRLGDELQQRLNDYVADTRFTDNTYLAHAYYWQQIYQNWYYNQDSVQIDLIGMANAFERAEFKSPELADMAKLTAGYAYFLNGDYTTAGKLFETVTASSDSAIVSYAKAYVGLMNLYGEVKKYNRRRSYALLQEGPKSGLFALYKGDANLVDYDLDLRERITRAADCYDSITMPHNIHLSTGFLTDMIAVRKNMVDSLIKTEPWLYPPCSDPYDNSIVTFEGPCINYLGNSHVADGWGVFTGREMNGPVSWCSIGDFSYFTSGRGRFRTVAELTFDFKDGYYIAYYAKDRHTLWGTTPGINNPAIYSCDITPLTVKFDIQELYGNPNSPIYRH